MKGLKESVKLISIVGPPDKTFAIKKNLNFLLRLYLSIINLNILLEAKKRKVTYAYLLMEADGKNLDQITPLIESGKIKAYIDRTYALADTLEALEYIASGRAKGKVVIKTQ